MKAFRVVCLSILLTLVNPGISYASEVIVNASVERSNISVRELRAIFGLRLTRWRTGEPIKVFVLAPDSSEHSIFCKNILKIFPHQLQAAWDRVTFSGTGQAPITVKTKAEMIRVISQTPGAIGYVETFENQNDGTVKTISIE